MVRRKGWLFILLVPLVSGLFGVSGCVRPEQPAMEAPAQPVPPPEQPPPPSPSDLPKPEPAELEAKIDRVYQATLKVEVGHEPPFLVGDFNGDLSQDVAVVVKPVDSKLEDINHELANWLRGDPVEAVLPKSQVVKNPTPDDHRIRIEPGDTLLAVIHGYGPDGWRNVDATQTYLLRHSVGKDMRTESKKDIVAAAKKGAKVPPVRGDVISETLGGESGFVYYNGARYLWFDPKTYKPEAPFRAIHGNPH